MISYILQQSTSGQRPAFLNETQIGKVKLFHESVPGYKPTPIVALNDFAIDLGVAEVYVKDESYRFGLNSFKSLGGIYAVARVVASGLGIEGTFLMPELLSEVVREKVKHMTFVTATDGNHGRGVAWAANMIGCKSVVYMPKGSSRFRFDAIAEFGARVEILEMNYDDAVRYANDKASENGWYIVQDTAWEGYEEVPNYITQGYTTMAQEAFDQLDDLGSGKVTHVLLQAGVGSMAGGVLGYMVNRFRGRHPKTIIMEAEVAACIYHSMTIGDGKPHAVSGDLDTIMAGLACGEANTITFDILKNFATGFMSCDDDVARLGMRVLAHPKGEDPVVISGESGAVGAGVLELVMKSQKYTELKEKLELDQNSVILFFSTEGDTDPESYKTIVGDL